MTSPHNGVTIDLAAGHSSVASISDIVDQMKAILALIQGSADGGQKGWLGEASRAFGSTHTEWQDIATRLNAALQTMESNLSTSFKGYDISDAEIGGNIRQAAAGGEGGLLRL